MNSYVIDCREKEFFGDGLFKIAGGNIYKHSDKFVKGIQLIDDQYLYCLH